MPARNYQGFAIPSSSDIGLVDLHGIGLTTKALESFYFSGEFGRRTY